MYYKIYSNIRDSAWRCLIDNHIDSLPVDIVKIADRCNIHIKKNSLINELSPDEDAKSFYNGHNWIIIYNDLIDIYAARFAIAHELGHIFLGHEKTIAKYSNVEEFGKKPKAEQQADLFAIRLLCPSCVLMRLNLSSPQEICDACHVPLSWAKKRSERMNKLNKANKFFTNELEIKVNENFKPFFEQNNVALDHDC